jgi:hypothetical protein
MNQLSEFMTNVLKKLSSALIRERKTPTALGGEQTDYFVQGYCAVPVVLVTGIVNKVPARYENFEPTPHNTVSGELGIAASVSSMLAAFAMLVVPLGYGVKDGIQYRAIPAAKAELGALKDEASTYYHSKVLPFVQKVRANHAEVEAKNAAEEAPAH